MMLDALIDARRPPREATKAVRVILLDGDGRRLLRGLRPRRRTHAKSERASRGPAASSAGCPTQAHRLFRCCADAGAHRLRGARLGRRASGFHIALAADFTVAADDARFWEPFMRPRLHPRQRRRRGCCRA